jgi:hypothetical protein
VEFLVKVNGRWMIAGFHVSSPKPDGRRSA